MKTAQAILCVTVASGVGFAVAKSNLTIPAWRMASTPEDYAVSTPAKASPPSIDPAKSSIDPAKSFADRQQKSTAMALAKYPDLGKLDSVFNSAFRISYAAWKDQNDPRLSTSDWPMTLATAVAQQLADEKRVAAAQSAPRIRPAAVFSGPLSQPAGEVASSHPFSDYQKRQAEARAAWLRNHPNWELEKKLDGLSGQIQDLQMQQH